MHLIDRIIKKFKRILLKNGINTFPKYFRKIEDIEVSPIFILGGNRSGTSLISSLLSQHPHIEGIFGKNNSPVLSPKIKHVVAYCTSHHVWDFLLSLKNQWANYNEGVLWGHPKHISKYYKDKPKNIKESLLLANAIQHYRNTDKTPLINSHFNMFRVGLIKKIFPKAKFVLIIKDHYEIIKSCSNKWSKDNIAIEYPKIGLHWFTLNSCCLYDLEKYASGDYCIIDYSQLFEGSEVTNKMLNDKLHNIGLNTFNYNLTIINQKFRFSENNSHQLQYAKYFGWIEKIISDEITLIKNSVREH